MRRGSCFTAPPADKSLTVIFFAFLFLRVFGGLSLRWNFTSTCFVNISEHEALRVLVLHLGDQRVAVYILCLAEISRLQWSHNEHRNNIENLFEQRIRPGLDR